MSAAGTATTWAGPPMVTVETLAHEVDALVDALAGRRAALVALSGIDGAGKSHVAAALRERLHALDRNAVVIGIDPWQHPQSERLAGADPGSHFYRHAIRFSALFEELVLPLVERRTIDLATQLIRTDADVHYEHRYRFDAVDAVLLEGIFLLQARFLPRYDLAVWLECSFASALRRALARNQEGLPPEAIRADYERVYFAAQRHHFAVDAPRARADRVIVNERDA